MKFFGQKILRTPEKMHAPTPEVLKSSPSGHMWPAGPSSGRRSNFHWI